MTDALFWAKDPDLFDFLEGRKKKVCDHVHLLTDDFLTNNDEDAVVQSVRDDFEIIPIVFDFDNVEIVQQGAKKINVKNDGRFVSFGPVTNPYVDGHFITFAIPYTGSRELFNFRSQNHTMTPIVAEILPTEVRLTIEDAIAFTEQSLVNQQEQYFSGIKHCAVGSQSQVGAFNSWVASEALRLIRERFKTVSERQQLVKALGFKIRKRAGQPQNVSQPIVRKKLNVLEHQLKQKSTDPTLELEIYDEILSICSNMAKVMELSPRAFAAMPEEDLRFHFLVQLNGVFEGQATGETFNLNGKTDILIKHTGENLFIAECKFWTGEKGYLEAIDQLLGYISWHDTKTALIIFNRNKDFDGVLAKIKAETLNHALCHAELDNRRSQTVFRYKFKHNMKSDRIFFLTVMAFNIPIP